MLDPIVAGDSAGHWLYLQESAIVLNKFKTNDQCKYNQQTQAVQHN